MAAPARLPLLEDRVAIVTGAARGIGRAIASAYVSEGARVVLADRDADAAASTATALAGGNSRTHAVAVDVGDRSSVERMVAATLDRYGAVHILVNNAGIDNAAPIAEVSDHVWEEMLRVNLTGVFLCTRAVVPTMIDQTWGRIISIGSQVALKGAERLAHYCAAKAGVHGFTRAVARELAPHGITANVIAPGPVDTALLASLPRDWREQKLAEVPLGRFAHPEEIAPTAVLLASPGGAYYTGATLNVSGGDVMAD